MLDEITVSAVLFDEKMQDNKQGHALTLIFKMQTSKKPEDIAVHKDLVDFLKDNVKATLEIETETNKKHSVVIEGKFWFSPKDLKKQMLLILEITIPYDKPTKKRLVELEYHELNVHMVKIQGGLDMEETEK
jgi:hypothetical protein